MSCVDNAGAGGRRRPARAYGAARLCDVLPRPTQLPVGGTAADTGLNAPTRSLQARPTRCQRPPDRR